jgi:UDP-glucose 4-epimerase
MTVVAVIGASGFVGSRVCEALRARGSEVREIRAPRVRASGRDRAALLREADCLPEVTAELVEALWGVDAVVNAAGLAAATSGACETLYGANALLPGLVSRASRQVGARCVHVSSAAVQGRRAVLDESPETAPFSPYSSSKALGEALALCLPGSVVFRPTSVHGHERQITRTLCRYAASRFAMVAAPGDHPTPQVHVTNVADAIAYVALTDEQPPAIVLQPDEGFTTGELLRLLGGRSPSLVPRRLARRVVALLFLSGRLSGRMAGVARRLEMLWFGQRQAQGWLQGRWAPVVTREGWRTLR